MSKSCSLEDRVGKLEELKRIKNEESERKSRMAIDAYYPDTGPLRRELYPRHMEFFAAGGQHQPCGRTRSDKIMQTCDGSGHRERLFLAANRVGKSEGVGAYETVLHLTGRYPKWWNGKRFDGPITAWVAGDTSKTVHKEILQPKLLGQPGSFGTGMLPGDAILRTLAKPGIPDAVETVEVKHVSGGKSILTLKTYEQGRESFQGTERHLIWLDEECPRAIYTECLLRTMETTWFKGGIIILTFTPLSGLTPLILEFLPELKPAQTQ